MRTDPAWTRAARDERDRNYAHFAADHEMSIAEYRRAIEEKVRRWVDGVELRVRVPPEVVPDVLEAGELRNQFATGGSRGLYDPDRRAAIEEALFGIGVDVGAAERPIYGYLSGSNEAILHQYGRAVIRLRPEVAARATFTLGDTLDDVQIHGPLFAPMPVTRPGVEAAPSVVDLYETPTLAQATRYGYAETQVHGGVSLADIEEIVFVSGIRPDDRTLDLLDENGIQWRIAEGDSP